MTEPFDSGVFDADVFDAASVSGDPGRRVVLCEITPSVRLRSWAVVPTEGAFDSGTFDDGAFDAGAGSGAAYYVAVERLLEAGEAVLYRRVVGVRQNGSDLVAAESAESVGATAGSWYWDETAGELYVRASTGTPDDYVMQAFVTYYFATQGVVINRVRGDADTGIYYQPWILELPGLTRQAAGLLFGITVVASGDLALTNGHGAWHALIPGHNWHNKHARFFVAEYADGAAVPDRDDVTAIMTMLVDGPPAANEVECAFKLGSSQRILEKSIPSGRFTRDDYPNLGDGVEGTAKRLGWGRAILRPDLTDTSGFGEYTIADADHQSLFSVEAVVAILKADGSRATLTETLHYTVDLAACTIALTGTDGYNAAEYEIECDVIGKPTADPTAYLKQFGEITRDILQTHLGVQDSDLDETSFAQADADEEAELSVWLKTPRTVASIFASAEPNGPSLERSVLGSVRQTADGLWSVLIWSHGSPDSGISLVKSDFVSFLPEPKSESIASVARVYYSQNQSDGSWATAAAEDLATRYLSETFDEAEFYTFLRDGQAAADLANRALLLVSAASVEVEFELRGAVLADVLAGDFVTVTYSPAPVAGQAFTLAAMELQRLDLSLSPVLQITGRLADTRAVGSRVGRVTDDSGVDWSSATDAEKASQGFVADDDGFIDPADATTEGLSIVW